VKFLQIWIFPNKQNVTPRYSQISLNIVDRHNNFQQIISPNPDDEGAWINQNAWFSMGNFDSGFETTYNLKSNQNGVYIFVLEGEIEVNGQTLSKRDGLGIWDIENFNMKALSNCDVLLMDVPMDLA
jgi:redox-sensitive bicupin YhaK (pirin superfamily)